MTQETIEFKIDANMAFKDVLQALATHCERRIILCQKQMSDSRAAVFDFAFDQPQDVGKVATGIINSMALELCTLRSRITQYDTPIAYLGSNALFVRPIFTKSQSDVISFGFGVVVNNQNAPKLVVTTNFPRYYVGVDQDMRDVWMGFDLKTPMTAYTQIRAANGYINFVANGELDYQRTLGQQDSDYFGLCAVLLEQLSRFKFQTWNVARVLDGYACEKAWGASEL